MQANAPRAGSLELASCDSLVSLHLQQDDKLISSTVASVCCYLQTVKSVPGKYRVIRRNGMMLVAFAIALSLIGCTSRIENRESTPVPSPVKTVEEPSLTLMPPVIAAIEETISITPVGPTETPSPTPVPLSTSFEVSIPFPTWEELQEIPFTGASIQTPEALLIHPAFIESVDAIELALNKHGESLADLEIYPITNGESLDVQPFRWTIVVRHLSTGQFLWTQTEAGKFSDWPMINFGTEDWVFARIEGPLAASNTQSIVWVNNEWPVLVEYAQDGKVVRAFNQTVVGGGWEQDLLSTTLIDLTINLYPQLEMRGMLDSYYDFNSSSFLANPSPEALLETELGQLLYGNTEMEGHYRQLVDEHGQRLFGTTSADDIVDLTYGISSDTEQSWFFVGLPMQEWERETLAYLETVNRLAMENPDVMHLPILHPGLWHLMIQNYTLDPNTTPMLPNMWNPPGVAPVQFNGYTNGYLLGHGVFMNGDSPHAIYDPLFDVERRMEVKPSVRVWRGMSGELISVTSFPNKLLDRAAGPNGRSYALIVRIQKPNNTSVLLPVVILYDGESRKQWGPLWSGNEIYDAYQEGFGLNGPGHRTVSSIVNMNVTKQIVPTGFGSNQVPVVQRFNKNLHTTIAVQLLTHYFVFFLTVTNDTEQENPTIVPIWTILYLQELE